MYASLISGNTIDYVPIALRLHVLKPVILLKYSFASLNRYYS